jgi:hypothetical protein
MASKKSKSKAKIKEFELSEEFQTKYSDITKIYIIGKVLILEHYTGDLIQSPYYNDDSIRTIKTLEDRVIESTIGVEFDREGFLKDFARLLGRRLLEDAQEEVRQEEGEETAQTKEEQQQKNRIREEIGQLRQQHQNITSEEWISTLRARYQNLYEVVQKEMPEIWLGLEFELSVHKILNLEGCSLPFIAIVLGRPSSYKTVIIELLKKWHNAFYTDNFTARSFVTHTTSLDSEEDLRRIDMLPKMKNNIFLTPELSPTFTTKEEDLTQTLGIITRIADGQGYVSDSGAHGHRGYDEPIMFTWVGAAVDIPWKVYKILNNLGHRLYFYRLHFRDESVDELTDYAIENEDFNTKRARIQESLFDYLKWFEINPDLIDDPNDTTNKKVRWDYSKDDKEALKIIAGMGDLLSYLRCIARVYNTENTQGSDYSYTISPREVPRRAIRALSNLARARATLEGRNYITMDDLGVIIKTATDSAMVERVSIFNLLLAYNGVLKTDQILASLRISRPTALRTMAEFHTTGLMYAIAVYHVLVCLLKLQLMMIVWVYWHIILRWGIMVKHHLMA